MLFATFTCMSFCAFSMWNQNLKSVFRAILIPSSISGWPLPSIEYYNGNIYLVSKKKRWSGVKRFESVWLKRINHIHSCLLYVDLKYLGNLIFNFVYLQLVECDTFIDRIKQNRLIYICSHVVCFVLFYYRNLKLDHHAYTLFHSTESLIK